MKERFGRSKSPLTGTFNSQDNEVRFVGNNIIFINRGYSLDALGEVLDAAESHQTIMEV
jgi:hypothetical protein